MFVSGYNSRPVIHVKDVKSGATRVMTFSDVIDKFGMDIKQDQLINAYQRAGNAFVGQMAQNFVVMRDEGVVPVGVRVRFASVQGRGRGGTPRGTPRGQPRGGRGAGSRAGGRNEHYANIQCFGCKQMGHYRASCPNVTPKGVRPSSAPAPVPAPACPLPAAPARSLPRKRNHSNEPEGESVKVPRAFNWGDE